MTDKTIHYNESRRFETAPPEAKIWRAARIVYACFLGLCLTAGAAQAKVYVGTPGNFRPLVRQLRAGDTLQLKAGVYRRILPIHHLRGEPGRPITITGPAQGKRAVFRGHSAHPLVSILDAAYVTIQHLELDGNGRAGDGVKAEGHAHWAHHITLQDLYIHGLGNDQQKVGISTKCPAWNWVIRRNVIYDAGTGMYLGNSNASDPFVAGLIEYNLVYDTLGYNLQVKHQAPRPRLPGLPRGQSVTKIRYNVFSKAHKASHGPMARPNVLVGHWPLHGPGKDDHYDIYANLFYQNPSETLFQGEGNIALHDNLFVNRFGAAVAIQAHNDVPRRIRIFHNTVLATDTGIAVRRGSPDYRQELVANAVFAGEPLHGGETRDNITAPYEDAADYLTAPDQLDLYPLAGKLRGSVVQDPPWRGRREWYRDFDGRFRTQGLRGAYGSDDRRPLWTPRLARRPAMAE